MCIAHSCVPLQKKGVDSAIAKEYDWVERVGRGERERETLKSKNMLIAYAYTMYTETNGVDRRNFRGSNYVYDEEIHARMDFTFGAQHLYEKMAKIDEY